MLKAALGSCVEQIADLERVIAFHEAFRTESQSAASDSWAKGAIGLLPEDSKWRRLEATMIVGALYAAWEKYVESAMAEAIDVLSRTSRFSALDDSFQKRYRRGFAHILASNEMRRFAHLSTKQMVDSYQALLADAPGSYLIPEVLVFHDGNLRMDEIVKLLAQVGIDATEKWIGDDPDLSEFVQTALGGSNTLKAELKNFVDLRNDLAHGNACDIPASEELRRHCAMIGKLTGSLNKLLSRRAFDEMRKAKKTEELGTIKEVFKDRTVAVIDSTARIGMTVGEEVFVYSASIFEPVEILEIQLNGAACQGFSPLCKIEVGLRMSKAMCRVGGRIERLIHKGVACGTSEPTDYGAGI